MKRRLTLALAAGALVAAMVPATASAGAPVGGCPTGAWWRIILPIHQPQAADQNGDQLLCRLDLPSGSFTFHDNVVR
jgi:hypothetical protein